MNKKRVLIFVLLLFFVTTNSMQLNALQIDDSNLADNASDDIYDDSGWKLVWQDEFNGYGRPNPKYWSSASYNRHPNSHGPDMYWLDDQVKLNGQGQLAIKMNRIPNRDNDNDPYDFATGMIRTKENFEKRYGKYEIRCKLPKKSGWWVAFWLMTDNVCKVNGNGKDGTEIDILEAFGWNNLVHHALHWDGYSKYHKSAGHTSKITNHNAYHTYTLIWTPTEYRFYIDGNLSWVTNKGGVSQVEQYIILSGEASTVGWKATNVWAKDPTKANYPDEFLIDYVRVYDYDFGVPPIVKEPIIFNVKGLTSSKETYRLGEQATWHADVEGDNVKYQYYVSHRGKNIDITRYAPNSDYSFKPSEPGYYTAVAFAYNGKEIKQVGSKKIKVFDEPIKLNSINVEQAKNGRVVCHVNAQGDGLKYSYYIIRNNKLFKYIPYSDKQSINYYPRWGDYFQFLVFVQDEYGNTLHKYSKKMRLQ